MPPLIRQLPAVVAALALVFVTASEAAPVRGQRAKPIWHGYGFLPGYRSPERIEWDNARARGRQWWYGPPRWYHGQWNHGGFGPCYTETPIGEIWNCGK